MRLPMPSEEEIEQFRVLYQRKVGRLLTPGEAREAATRVLHFYFLTNYAIHSIQPEE